MARNQRDCRETGPRQLGHPCSGHDIYDDVYLRNPYLTLVGTLMFHTERALQRLSAEPTTGRPEPDFDAKTASLFSWTRSLRSAQCPIRFRGNTTKCDFSRVTIFTGHLDRIGKIGLLFWPPEWCG